MKNLTPILMLFSVILICVPLIIYLLMRTHVKMMEKQFEAQRIENQTLRAKILELTQEMMNRSQAGDLHSFLSLQANQGLLPPMETEYRPRTDEAELEIIGKSEGLGTVQYDEGSADELSEVFGELGAFGFTEREPRGTGTQP